MKKLVLMFVALMTIASASAQTEGNKDERDSRRGDRTEWMVKELGLSAQQAEQLKELNAKYPELQRRGRGHHGNGNRGPRPGMQPRPDGNSGASAQAGGQQRPSREEMEKRFAERRAQMDAYNKELQGILTADQFKAYEERMAQMRQNRPRRPMP